MNAGFPQESPYDDLEHIKILPDRLRLESYAFGLKEGSPLSETINRALLDRVVESTGAKTKTAAIDLALREMDRRARLTQVLSQGSGLHGEELANMFDPASDPTTLRAAEDPDKYGMEHES